MSRETEPETVITASGVSFAYGKDLILRNVSFDVRRGEFVSIIGPSGCGKSTLLTMLAGMLKPQRGEIHVGGTPVTGPGPDRAMVFQNFALLPWKSVLDNVILGVRYNRPELKKRGWQEEARHMLALVGLSQCADLYPYQLSGGMQQRVGLARAFAANAPILLMDEPFGAIDAQNAEILREELRELIAREARTIVFITHNLDEALFLSDRILLMGAHPGRIVESLTVDLPHPRGIDVDDPEMRAKYGSYRGELWSHLRREVTAGSALAEGEAGA